MAVSAYSVETFILIIMAHYFWPDNVISSDVKLKFYGISKRDLNSSLGPVNRPIVKKTFWKDADQGFVNILHYTASRWQPVNTNSFCKNITKIRIQDNKNGQRSTLLKDARGNLYDFYQFTNNNNYNNYNYNYNGQSKSDIVPCLDYYSDSKNRLKRQFQPIQPLINNSNVIVNASDSNITITQLINITSGMSVVEIRESAVRLMINSQRSNVRINPKENFVNISVTSPYLILNTSQRQSLDMTTLSSEIYVVTQKGGQNYSVIADSGPTNMTVRQGSALIQATADMRSKITVTGYLSDVRDQILINSRVIDQTTYTRELTMIGLTQNVRTEIQLVRGLISIIYNQVQIRVSAVDHEILIYTGVYTVRISTLLSPFNISVTDTVDVLVDNSTISVYPDTSNITGKIPHSLMLLRPDNSTNIQFQTDQSGTSALTNASVDVESSNLTLEVIPRTPRIYAVSIDSRAVIGTPFSNVGLTANRSIIEVLSGTPYINVLTGNTSIEIRAGSGGITFPTGIPPPVTLSPVTSSSSGSTTLTQVTLLPVTTPPVTGGPVTQATGSSSSSPIIPTVFSSSFSLSTPQSTVNSSASNFSSPPISVITTPSTPFALSTLTPNISTQVENGTSRSVIDITAVLPNGSTPSLSTHPPITVVSNNSISSQSGATVQATSPSSATITQNSTLPSTELSPTPSSLTGSGSLSSTSSSSSNTSEGVTISGPTAIPIVNRTIKIYPFPFPVVIPWPLPTQSLGNASTVTRPGGGGSTTSSGGIQSSTETGVNNGSSMSTTSGSSGVITVTSASVGTSETSIFPFPPTFPLSANTTTRPGLEITTAPVLKDCPYNTSSDFVCIDARIDAIQIPETNSTSVPEGASQTFVITQYNLSVATLPNAAVTLQLPATAATSVLPTTTTAVLPQPPDFLPLGSVQSSAAPLLQNTLQAVQASSINTPAELAFLNAPPDKPYMLSLAVKVKRSLDSNSENFTKLMQEALKVAYIEGRNRQLGVNQRRILRSLNIIKRQINTTVAKVEDNNVEIKLISIDRPIPDEAKVRFYVMTDNKLVEAKKAKETYDQLNPSELSALLTYPVVQSVQPLEIDEDSSSTALPVVSSDSGTIIAIILTLVALLLIFAVGCFVVYKYKNRTTLLRKTSNASRASTASEHGDDKRTLNSYNPKGVIIEPAGNNDRPNYSKRIHLGDLPPLPSTGPRLVKDMSDKDLVSYDNMSYSELFEYVNQGHGNQPNVVTRIVSPRGNKVAPLTPLSPSPVHARWRTTNSKKPPSSDHATTQVVRISPGTRRRLAKDLLDTSFPLVNVNIDEVIRVGGR